MFKTTIADSYHISTQTLTKWLKLIKDLGKPIGRHYTPEQVKKIEERYGKISPRR